MNKKISIKDLEVGMYIADIDRPWIEVPFFKRFISSQSQIDNLIQYSIHEVYINTSKGKDFTGKILITPTPKELFKDLKKSKTIPQKSDFNINKYNENISESIKIITKTKEVMHSFFDDAKKNNTIPINSVKSIANDMVELILTNNTALSSLNKVKDFDEYTYTHSVNVCILALSLGNYLNFSSEQLQILGVGALLHDIGKIDIPESIINKAGRLTEKEFVIIKKHPLLGYKKLLEKSSELNPASLDVVLDHHERFNGRGYPRGLAGSRISRYGLMLAIVDVYDAITNKRVYHKAVPPFEGINKIYEWGRNDFDFAIVKKFIECIGLYPLGSLVQLTSNEVGVVHSVNHLNLHRPKVLLILDKNGKHLKQPIFTDLSLKDEEGFYLRSIVKAIGHDDDQ